MYFLICRCAEYMSQAPVVLRVNDEVGRGVIHQVAQSRVRSLNPIMHHPVCVITAPVCAQSVLPFPGRTHRQLQSSVRLAIRSNSLFSRS